MQNFLKILHHAIVKLENIFALNSTRADRYLPFFKNYVKEAQVILDLGCGSGELANLTSNYVSRVISLDLDKKQLRKCRGIHLERICGDAQCLPFTENTFDCILSFSLIEHLPVPRAHAKESHRVLRANGLAIIQLPNLKYVLEPHTKVPLLSVLPLSIQSKIFRRLNYAYVNMSLTLNKCLTLLADEGFDLQLMMGIYHLQIMRILIIPPAYIFIFRKTFVGRS